MKHLRQICIILIICFVGEIIHSFLKVPIPGNVLGMIILLTLLCTGVLKLEMIEEVSEFLLKHLAFFFIPAGVGLISCLDTVKSIWLPLLTILVITTIIVMGVTGITVQLLKGEEKDERTI